MMYPAIAHREGGGGRTADVSGVAAAGDCTAVSVYVFSHRGDISVYE